MTRRAGALLGSAVALSLLLPACSNDGSPADPAPTTTSSASPAETSGTSAPLAELSYGVFGTTEEVAAYQAVVEAYNATATTVEVTLLSWPTSRAMMRDIAAGADAPDVYQVTRDRLTDVVDEQRNVPLFSLLEDRDISYGDNYPLDAIEAFSRGNDLQCMPYGISPTVMYVNTDLVDFDRMRQRGLPAPSEGQTSWDMEEFAAAAEFATRPRLKSRGVTIDATLEGLAPYVYSGGGTLFDDDTDPTSLDLSSGDNQETLATVLAIARNPLTTLTDTQLERATPQEWFERGRLGFLAADRSVTPDLRDVPDLSFDVMAMPRVGRSATTGDVTGVCISPGPSVQRAADFLVHLISAEGFAPVAEAGYLVPANTSVARSAAFLQPLLQPANSGVFNAGVDTMELLPLEVRDPALDAAVSRLVTRLFTSTLPPDLELVTAQIDVLSRPVLDPTYVLDPSDIPSPTGSPTLPLPVPSDS